jgi:hypothetical protein
VPLLLLVATSFCGHLSSRGEEVQYLTQWHTSVRADCSSRFRELKETKPNADRAELNQERDLQLLNGIRRGVHRAMVKSLGRTRV